MFLLHTRQDVKLIRGGGAASPLRCRFHSRSKGEIGDKDVAFWQQLQ